MQVTEVQKALGGMDYPASRDDLVAHAEGNGASAEVLDELRQMADDTYESPAAVMKGLKGHLGGPTDDD